MTPKSCLHTVEYIHSPEPASFVCVCSSARSSASASASARGSVSKSPEEALEI